MRMVGRGRLLVVNHGEHDRRRLQKRNMGAPLHSHFSNDTLRFQEDHLFTNWAGLFFSASLLSFFSFSFSFFFFLEHGCLLCAICDTWLRASRSKSGFVFSKSFVIAATCFESVILPALPNSRLSIPPAILGQEVRAQANSNGYDA